MGELQRPLWRMISRCGGSSAPTNAFDAAVVKALTDEQH